MQCRRNAFTLIEILVAVTIIAIAAAIIVPSLGSGQDATKVSAATRIVMSDLLYAQNCAITSQKPAYVYFYNEDPAGTGTKNGFDISYTNTAPSNASECLPGPDSSRLSVRFNGNQSDPFNRTQISTASAPKVKDGANVSVLRFTSLGEPEVKDSGGNFAAPTNTVEIPISSRNGSVTTKLILQPYTGEISLD